MLQAALGGGDELFDKAAPIAPVRFELEVEFFIPMPAQLISRAIHPNRTLMCL